MKLLHDYQNGNYNVKIYSDGTKVRETQEDEFLPEFSENIDIKITDWCDAGCKFCFPEGTNLLDSNFKNIDISKIKIGDIVIGFDEFPQVGYQKRKIKKTKVTNIFKRNVNKTIKIYTNSSVIESSEEHPFLTTGHGKLKSQYDYKSAKNLKTGDIIYRISGFQNVTEIDYDSDNFKIGYIVSCFMGDGTFKKYIDKNGYDVYNSRFAVKDKEISTRLFEYLQYFNRSFYWLPFKMGKDNKEYSVDSVRSNKKDEYEFIINLINGNFNKNKTIEYFSGFLSGIYDCEGHIGKTTIRICNCNKNIINEIQEAMNFLNIENILEVDKKGTVNYELKYNVRICKNRNWIKFLRMVYPATPRKGLINLIDKSLLDSERILTIEIINSKNIVYNIETESHTYFANNLAVHNCHEMSTRKGQHGNMNVGYLKSLHPGTELAIGGGNPLDHPNIINFLRDLKELGIISNLTVNQFHFEKEHYEKMIDLMLKENLVYGLGISMLSPTLRFINKVKNYDNLVIHTINGVTSNQHYEKISNHNLKILILGYKNYGRGLDYHSEKVETKKTELYDILPSLISKFKIVSFDNLAIQQLNPKRMMTQNQWNQFYMGDDGNYTFYIDMIQNKFAKNSTSYNKYDIQDEMTIQDMFNVIQSNN